MSDGAAPAADMEDKTMATTTPSPLPEDLVTAPKVPGPRNLRRFPPSGLLSWAAILAAIAAAVTLAVVALTGGDDDTNPVVGAHTGLIEHGSIRSIEGSVEDTGATRGQPAPDEYPPNYYPHGYDYGAADNPAAGGTVPSDGPKGLAERGSVRSSEGSVEDRSSS
jgi:hypothetical protein